MNSRVEFEKNRTYYLKMLPKECANCGEINDLDIHHIVPLAKGGTNRISNLVMWFWCKNSKALASNLLNLDILIVL
ncbi:HNH endonuclease, partial [Bacillus pretiosus]|uniref:HNH endonuclease n=1 Tax=Bacillus pretiosus TaxID=2983392 RepID=UPI003D65D614